MFYGSAVWLNKMIKSVHWRIINSIRYRAVRLAIGDIRNRLPRLSVNRISKRLSPHQWMLYSNAKMAINLINLEHKDPRLSKTLKSVLHQPKTTKNDNCHGLKVGHNAFQNRLQCLKKVQFEWLGDITTHALRINLKRTFMPAYQ